MVQSVALPTPSRLPLNLTNAAPLPLPSLIPVQQQGPIFPADWEVIYNRILSMGMNPLDLENLVALSEDPSVAENSSMDSAIRAAMTYMAWPNKQKVSEASTTIPVPSLPLSPIIEEPILSLTSVTQNNNRVPLPRDGLSSSQGVYKNVEDEWSSEDVTGIADLRDAVKEMGLGDDINTIADVMGDDPRFTTAIAYVKQKGWPSLQNDN